MFSSHELHLRAETILRRADLAPGMTFRRWSPVCAIGHLASESGYVHLDLKSPNSTTEGSEVVRRIFGLTEEEIARIMATNDGSGPDRPEKLAVLLRSFCPVCGPLIQSSRSLARIAESICKDPV
jgi:hypothetical protein